jgi:glycosyltransferase involved in cell wall biosynthesis
MYYLVAYLAENTILKSSTVAILHINQLEKIKSGRYFTRFRYVTPAISGKFFEKMDGQVKQGAGKITLGYCGRLDPEKGIEKLFIASEICRKEYNITNLHLLLVGDGTEGHRLAGKYPNTDTTITGFVDDVIPYLDTMDVFTLPSETEVTSISSLEAYSRGLKVFSTPVGFVGQNANLFPKVYNFRTAEELALLVKEKAGRSFPSPDGLSDAFMDSVITFSKLYEMVKYGAL